MKKVGVVTYWYARNIGALLQNYALVTFLRNLGVKAYTYKFKAEKFSLKRIIKNILIRFKLGKLLKKPFDEAIFNKFRKKYIKNYARSKNLDFYVCGSDQIWNLEIVRDKKLAQVFFLQFTEKFKRVSYAASIGRNSIEAEDVEYYRKYLEDFKVISVREESAKALIEEVVGLDATVNIDPVFLLSVEQWRKIQKKSLQHSGKYVLGFFLGDFDQHLEMLFEFARKNNAELKIISFYTHCKDYEIKINSINEFLSLIDGAEYVFTDSFHGTAFSIIYQKQFYSVKRVQRGCPDMTSRIANLFSNFGINRWMETNDILEKNQQIDYIEFEEIINNERKRTEKYFKEILEL